LLSEYSGLRKTDKIGISKMLYQYYKICFIIVLMIFNSRSTFAQDKVAYNFGSNIGNEITREEADRYDLFPGFAEFVSARFYEQLNGGFEIDIKYMENGEISEQVWYITKEEFTENYLKKLNKNYVIKTARPYNPDEQILKIRTADHASFRGKLVGIENYALELKGNEKTDSPATRIPVNNVEQVSVLRWQNPGKALLIGLIPGAVAGFVGFLSGDDEPGFLSFSRGDKAVIGFLFGGFIGLNISGSIAAMRSVDFDIPLGGQSQEEKLETFSKIYSRTIPKKLYFRINPWFAFHSWTNENHDGNSGRIVGYMPGIRAKIYLTPRSGAEFSLGGTDKFNRSIGYYEYEYNPQTDTYSDVYKTHKYEITYFSGGFFIALTRYKVINPVFSWGWGYYKEKNPDYYGEENERLAVHFKLGLEHHVNRWMSVDMRLGPVFDFNRIYLVGELGISLGKFF
jgi:hypothetical protein